MMCAHLDCEIEATHAVVVFIPDPRQVKVCEPHADEAMAHGSTSKVPVSWLDSPAADQPPQPNSETEKPNA